MRTLCAICFATLLATTVAANTNGAGATLVLVSAECDSGATLTAPSGAVVAVAGAGDESLDSHNNATAMIYTGVIEPGPLPVVIDVLLGRGDPSAVETESADRNRDGVVDINDYLYILSLR